MFDSLQKRLSTAVSKVRGKSRIQESDIDAVLSEIRTGLLEADVHFRVARDFLARVRERCLRADVLASLSPEQQILKVLSEELTAVLGQHNRELNFSATPPAVILLCGLQGSGKTTSAAKLAALLKQKSKRPGVVSVDVYRPAARTQLATLAKKLDIPVLVESAANQSPLEIVKLALKEADAANLDVLIVDTAGRLQVDEALMKELSDLHEFLKPSETLLVIDAMTGQQAVEVAESFDQCVSLSGAILSKLDGDTKGGAALSLVSVTAKPIKFIGTGERPSDFEAFYPDRMASRLLDMGDVLSLIEKAEQVISQDEALGVMDKMKNPGAFSLQDFQEQMKLITRMGPVSGLFKMLPGMGAIKEHIDKVDTEKELRRINAIINSMTPDERKRPEDLNGSRRARIAKGSGTEVSEVNQLVKRFLDARKAMKQMGRFANMFGGGGAGLDPSKVPMGGAFRKGPKGFGRKF